MPYPNAAYGEFFKAFSDIKPNMPNVDLNGLLSFQRRNLETITSFNQAVAEGAQAISRRGAEIMREGVEDFLNVSREMMTGASPETNAQKQAEFARTALESSISNLREISELATKSSFEAFDVLNKRVAEGLGELSDVSSATTTGRRAKSKKE